MIDIRLGPGVPPGSASYAAQKIRTLAHSVPITRAEVILRRSSNPTTAWPALVQQRLDVAGRVVRASIVSGTFGEAIDLLDQRTRQRLSALASASGPRQPTRPQTAAS